MAKLKLKVQGPWRAWHNDVLSGMLQRPDGGGVPVLVRYLPVGSGGSRDDGRLLSATRHPNVLRTLQLSMVNQRAVAVHEGFEGASAERVLQTLRSRNMFIPVRAALEIVQGVAEAIESASAELDGMQVVHPGPTPLEVLIDSQGKIKLAGFVVVGGDRPYVSGPAGYEPPEAQVGLKGASYGLGALLVELLAGERPSAGSGEPNRHEAMIRRALIRVLARPGENAPDGVINLVRQCMSRDPDERPTPGDVAARLTGLASGLRSPGLRAWAPGVVPTVLQIERVDAARASATIVPEDDMLAAVPPALVPGPTRAVFTSPSSAPAEPWPASLPSPSDDSSTQVLPRGGRRSPGDDEESDLQPLIPPTQSDIHQRRPRRVLLEEGPAPGASRGASAPSGAGLRAALPPAGSSSGVGALPDAEPPTRKAVRPRKSAPPPPAAAARAPDASRGPLPLEEIGLGDDYVDAPTTVMRPDLPLPLLSKPATPLFEAQDLVALRGAPPPGTPARGARDASPDRAAPALAEAPATVSQRAHDGSDEQGPLAATAPRHAAATAITTPGQPAAAASPSAQPRGRIEEHSPAADDDYDEPMATRSGMRLGIGLLLGVVAAGALFGAIGLAAWSMRGDDAPAADAVAATAPVAPVAPVASAADVLAGDPEPPSADDAALARDAAAAEQAAAEQATAEQAAAEQAAASKPAPVARGATTAAVATPARGTSTAPSAARAASAASVPAEDAAPRITAAVTPSAGATNTTTSAPAASSAGPTAAAGSDTFRVEFRSADATYTELDVRCHVGTAKGPSPVVISNAGRGPCKVVGRGGESPVVAVVSLTGAAAYTCFANGERACN